MKRTTYIFIGILVSVLVILMAGVVYISFQKSETNSYTLTLSEKILRTEFSGIRAVKVYANDTRRVWLDEACVNVVSSTDGKTRLLSPESEYLKISQNADTLVICLDLTTYDLPKQKKEYLIPALQAKGLQLTIEADSNLAFVANAIRGLRKTRLLSPESEYLKISQNADTLVICLDLTTYDLPKQKKEYLIPALQAKGLQLTIEADSNLAFVANAIRGLRTRIDRLHADSLTTYIRGGELRLDSCEIRAFCVDGDGVTFNAHQSIIPHLYLDLDGVRNWGVHESVIGTEHLTGSGVYHNNLQRGECKKMIWTPKKEDAELRLTIREKGSLILQEE